MDRVTYLNGTELECDGHELRPDGTCERCSRINQRIGRLTEAAVQAEREAILRTLRLLHAEHSPTHDWAKGLQDAISTVEARGKDGV